MLPFNKPYIIGKELEYIKDSVESGRTSGDGKYTFKCQELLEERFEFKKTLLTTSCTAALEMCALMLNLDEDDEVIMPSFTFVSTANAFALRGAKIIFADSDAQTLNITPEEIEKLISPKTKAIVVVHYAGVACKMDEIKSIAQKNNITLIEDAALGFDAYYKNQALGTFGDFATFSFHETKNISCGEGGALVINNPKYFNIADIIRDKGTNRKSFQRGEVEKYEWVSLGSSYLMSDISAAYLYAQLECIDIIQDKRLEVWNKYHNELNELELGGKINLPHLPGNITNNGSMFFILCQDYKEREQLIQFLQEKHIKAVFHYSPLHKSPFYKSIHGSKSLPISETYSEALLRLPLFYEISEAQQNKVIESIYSFYS